MSAKEKTMDSTLTNSAAVRPTPQMNLAQAPQPKIEEPVKAKESIKMTATEVQTPPSYLQLVKQNLPAYEYIGSAVLIAAAIALALWKFTS